MKTFLTLLEEHGLLVNCQTEWHDESLPFPRTDHREIKAGDAFIAIKGERFDGHQLIGEARKLGAALIVGEDHQADIQVKDSRKAAALYASEYYGRPSQHFTLYGVTGTNGKTTVSLMLFQLLRLMGYSCGWIGTLGYRINEEQHETAHTTPDIMQLNAIFQKMADAGVQHVVMEVSSHALALDRVYNVQFDYCLFTNLSRDHLDFHKNMDEYFSAKYMLFERAIRNSAVSVVNIDDDHGRIIADRLQSTGAGIFSVGHASDADFMITDAQTRLDGSSFKLVSKDKQAMEIASPLIGSFNVDNLALALGTLLAAKHDKAILTKLIERLMPVPGRIEAVTNDLGIGIYVDYAHTPDAIINLLKSINKLPHGRVISVIGAGGNRDTGKRPLMLQAALRFSDAVIITDDNPRHENPNLIIQDIVRDRELSLPWWIIRDRGTAIASAIRLARKGDVVLICGKGHENYQETKGVRHHFDDREAARESLAQAKQNKADDEMLLPLDPLMLAIVEEQSLDENCSFDGASYRFLSTDSRSIKPESMFFAIKGENFDGNRFISNVLKQDSCFAVGNVALPDQKRYFQTSDCALLMSKLMQKYLLMFDIHKTALTGSTGKTSTKELLTAILEEVAPTLKTLKNENNIIGLCKTILRIEPNHRFGVFEIGTNHFGEIALLSDTIMPDAGIILNVGPSHLEYFGDEDGVMREKTDLFHRALDLRLYPADDPRFELYHESGKSVGYADDAVYRISDVRDEAQGKSFDLSGTRYTIPYSAPHYVINSAFAIAMALNLGIEASEIQHALFKPVSLDMRMQVEKLRGGYLIVDCYNANPVSMQSALEFWRDLHPEKPHVAFLGDMLELGTQADMYHQMIGAMLAEIRYEELYTVGKRAVAFSDQPCRHYPSVEDLIADFPSLPEHTVILVKASHGIHLERLLPKLRGED